MIRKLSVRGEVLESRNLLLEAPSLEMRGFIKRCDKEMMNSRRSLKSRNQLLEAPRPEMRGFIKRWDKEMIGSRRGPGIKKSTPGGAWPENERLHKEM